MSVSKSLSSGDSLCERKAHVFRRRQHASMTFRSFVSLGNACDMVAAVDNMEVSGGDVFFDRHRSMLTFCFDRPSLASP